MLAALGMASRRSTLRHAKKKAESPDQPVTLTADVVDIYGRSLHPEDEDDEDVNSCQYVMKIFCVHSAQDPLMPWTNKPQEESTGSGCAVQHDGVPCILTNAHVVSDATYVEVRKAGDAKKYTASRLKISHECDLALLSVADEDFWSDVQPLEFGSQPHLQDEVAVVGYPEGGEGVSITQGVVSRIEIQTYVHSGAALLAIQIDAAINLGNSGGPVLDEDDRLIGVAFQNTANAQNIGYVIPLPIILHFLEDTNPEDSSRCSGFCSMGVFFQTLENQQLRDFVGIGHETTGVLVRGLTPLSTAARLLEQGDVIMVMDGQQIANDGTFLIGRQERLSFQHLIHLKFPGEQVNISVLRGGENVNVQVPVRPMGRLVPTVVYDSPQPYFIYGGLVFVPLSQPYLQEWGEEWRSDAPSDLVNLALHGLQTQPEEQPVMLSKCFPSELTAGYSMLNERIVTAVCDSPVLNLRQMYALVQKMHATRPFVQITVQCTGFTAFAAVNTTTADSVCKDIMRTYRIPTAASPELLESQAEPLVAAGGANVTNVAAMFGQMV